MADFPVTNEGRAVATKGTPHVAVNTRPDICLLPDGKPKPFPNHIETKRLGVGKTVKTFIAGHPIWTQVGELDPPSEPAHEGVNGGQTNGIYRGKCTPTKWSKDLFAEGNLVVRTDDTTAQNQGNTDGKVVFTTRYFGLFDPNEMIAFCKKWRALMDNWKKMSKAERLAAMEEAINERLKAAGVRPISLDSEKMPNPNTNGHFDWREWGIAINETRLADDATEAQLVRLGNTVYHEGRHAEQLWYTARYVASGTFIPNVTGTPAGAAGSYIATRGSRTITLTRPPYSYPLGASFQASGQPIQVSTPQGQLGRDVHESLFGSNSAARNTSLIGLNDAAARIRTLQGELDTIDSFVGPPTAEQAAHRADVANRLAQARADEAKFYQEYRALPEEKDAWDVGEAFGASC